MHRANWLLCLVLVLVGGSFADAELIGITTNETKLYRINEATGAATLIAPIIGPGNDRFSYSGATFFNGDLYASDYIYQPDDAPRVKYTGTIDIDTGVFTPVVVQGQDINWPGLAASQSTGLLYTINSDNDLLSIDPISGDVTLIGETDPNIHGWGLAYDDSHGVLYAVNTSWNLFTVDTSNAIATKIGEMGDMLGHGGEVGLAYDEDSQILYANSNNYLYTVDVLTAEATLVGANNLEKNIDGLAWRGDSNAVPEPSTLASLGSLLGMGLVAGWWRRRRKQ